MPSCVLLPGSALSTLSENHNSSILHLALLTKREVKSDALFRRESVMIFVGRREGRPPRKDSQYCQCTFFSLESAYVFTFLPRYALQEADRLRASHNRLPGTLRKRNPVPEMRSSNIFAVFSLDFQTLKVIATCTERIRLLSLFAYPRLDQSLRSRWVHDFKLRGRVWIPRFQNGFSIIFN